MMTDGQYLSVFFVNIPFIPLDQLSIEERSLIKKIKNISP